MAAMAARTVSNRLMTFGVGDTVSKVLARMQEDDYSSSLQLHKGSQAKPSKKKRSQGDR